MNCNSNHSLFLRSNGSLACWDDAGSRLTLQAFDPAIDYARDVYLGPVFEAIRARLRAGKMPFPDHCSNCLCMMTDMPMDDGHHQRTRLVEVFQIEPSMGCQLECPGCMPRRERPNRVERTPHGHLTLKPEILEKIVTDLHRAHVTVGKFDFQGHGEPLLHRNLWEMTRRVAELYPRAVVSICSHANFKYRPEMVHSGVNELLFAIDGMDGPSYEPYRIGGDFDVAYTFMREFSQAAARENAAIQRIWKYVVFAHNDRPDQLLRAQELALEANITEMRFMLTQLGPLSCEVTDEAHIPLLDPRLNVKVVNYRVKYEQFRTALDGLASAIATGDQSEMVTTVNFITNMLFRLFRTASRIPREYDELIEEFVGLGPSLPIDLWQESRGRLEALRAGVEARHPTDEQLRGRIVQFDSALRAVVANNNRLANRLAISDQRPKSGPLRRLVDRLAGHQSA